MSFDSHIIFVITNPIRERTPPFVKAGIRSP